MAAAMVTRWRVRYSTKTTHWFYCARVAFVDAETPAQAAADVERAHTNEHERAEAWETVPATEDMEAAQAERERRQAEWLRLAKSGQNPRGLL